MEFFTEKEPVVLLLAQVSAQEYGQGIHQFPDLLVTEPGNQGGQQRLAGEDPQKITKGSLVRGPVQAKTDGGRIRRLVHWPWPSESTVHQTRRLRGPSYSQKKIRCQVPSFRAPSSLMTVTELPVRVAIMCAGELPSR